MYRVQLSLLLVLILAGCGPGAGTPHTISQADSQTPKPTATPAAGPTRDTVKRPTQTAENVERIASSVQSPTPPATPVPATPVIECGIDPANAPPLPSRESSREVAAEDLANLVEGNTAFAVDLYRELSISEGNLFYSPYSISLALAMAHAGARGETKRQMAETLGFRLPQARLHPAFNALDLAVAVPATTEDGREFEMSIVNSVWGQQGHQFLPTYLDTLALNYAGNIRHADFRRSPGDAAAQINGWVSDETQDRINDLISP